MLNSLILQTYSPLIIPLSFMFGVNFVERDLVYKDLSLFGIFFIAMSLLIFYDRTMKHEKALLATGLGLFFVSYVVMRYYPFFKYTSILLMLVSLGLIATGVSKFDIEVYNNQYIYLALLTMFVATAVMIPYERNNYQMFNISFVLLILAYTVLVYSCIDAPAKALK